ncbi:MAG: hypothetical protein LJF04_07115 [Gemmatimonadetes bacterium]|nr:hypothetical protein [Gemmatimonadota bacterium]
MIEPPLFSKLDADRILRRAAEIEGSEDARALTLDELRSIAGEAGFGRQAVERAIAEAQESQLSGGRSQPVQKWGVLIAHLSTMREIPVEISSDELMRVVRLFQPYREGPAHVKLEEHQITWRDRKGLRFAVTSAGGMTEIRVYVSKFLLRRGRWMGWVKSAADRLESLTVLVSRRDVPAVGPGRRS